MNRQAVRALLMGSPLCAALLGTLLLTAACGGPHVLTPEERQTRLQVEDFSILAPQEGEWVLQNKSPTRVVLFSRRTDTRSLLVSVVVVTVGRPFASQEELLADIRRYRTVPSSGERFQNSTHEEAADSRFGPFCIRYHMLTEDHGAANRGKAPFLLLRDEWMTCFHPDRATHLVHLLYSERSLPEERTANLAQDADRCFATLQFSDRK